MLKQWIALIIVLMLVIPVMAQEDTRAGSSDGMQSVLDATPESSIYTAQQIEAALFDSVPLPDIASVQSRFSEHQIEAALFDSVPLFEPPQIKPRFTLQQIEAALFDSIPLPDDRPLSRYTEHEIEAALFDSVPLP